MLAVPIQALFGQLLIGLINGSFYALLSLGLAIIFGLLNVINFCHGALYMLGAFVAWFLMDKAGIGYWPALILAPLAVGIVGVGIERGLLRRISGLDPLYGLLLTFGLALILQGLFSNWFGSSGMPYEMPARLQGGRALGLALAAFAGVLAAPIYRVSPLMGADLIIVVFAVVVIGGIGFIIGTTIT